MSHKTSNNRQVGFACSVGPRLKTYLLGAWGSIFAEFWWSPSRTSHQKSYIVAIRSFNREVRTPASSEIRGS